MGMSEEGEEFAGPTGLAKAAAALGIHPHPDHTPEEGMEVASLGGVGDAILDIFLDANIGYTSVIFNFASDKTVTLVLIMTEVSGMDFNLGKALQVDSPNRLTMG